MRKYFSTTALLAVLICTTPPLAAATPSEFYANLLRRGIAAHDAGRFDEAARQLRFAAFGSVDAVESYQTAQVYLALTYMRLNEPDRAREAVRRVIHAERIERRFARVSLPATVRTAFDKIAAGVLSPAEQAALRGTGELPAPPPTPVPLRTTTSGSTTQPLRPQTTTTQPAPTQSATTPVTQPTPSGTTTTGTTPAPTTTTTTTQTAPPATVDRVEVEVTKPAATATTQRPQTQTPQQTAQTQTPQTQRPQTPIQTPQTQTTAPATQTPARTPAQQPSTTPTTTQNARPAPAQSTPQPAATSQQPARNNTPLTIPTTPAPRTTTTTTPAAPITRPAAAFSASEVALRFAGAERALVSANLAEARRLYRELLANAASADHGTALRIAEGLYRARDFAGALAAFDRAGALRRGEEPYRYYIAVALYETRQYERARRELAAALPYIEVTPDVERYRGKIQSAIQ